MDDSIINPILLSSSAHLENVEQLIKNLEQQTADTTSFSSNAVSIQDNFFNQSITLPNSASTINLNDGNLSMDSLLFQPDLFNNEQQTLSTNDQDNAFTWDDQYDARANYRLTFSTDKSQQIDSKSRRHKHPSTSQKTSSSYSDDDILSNVTNNMTDWSMRSSLNPFEQSTNQQQQIRYQSNASESLSTSWRQMKESQRLTTEIPTKETRSSSPFNLYKIFQQKSNITSSSRSAFHIYQQQNDSILLNHTTKISTEKSKISQSHLSTDQAIQTSIFLDSSSNSQYPTSFKSISSSAIHKSLPDLSFISQYSKELPLSRSISPLPPTSSSSINISRTTPSPTLILHQKQDLDRPRTLKSIKRYKNSKHSTEPLGVFYSPQLRKTYAAIPASAIITGSNAPATLIKMKCPSSFAHQQTLNLKSCLKYGSRANSCDIQAMLQDRTSPVPSLSITESTNSQDSKRRCSEADIPNLPDTLSPPNNLHTYHSEYDLTLENQAKKSVSFSENISKHLISPCNPTITFNDNLPLILNERLTKKRYGEMRRCQTDIIVVDPVLHLHSFTDSPPNEFCLQRDEDEDEVLMENSHINIIPNHDEPVAINTVNSIEKDNLPMNTSTVDSLLERISDIIKRLFDIKRSNKTFFLNNENNPQLDSLLKNDLCLVIQNILEHGRKDLKKITLWKIIETSMEQTNSFSRQIPQVYYEAKQIAQNTSSNWLYKFQAFIFALLNKNELINWLYYFTRQKDVIQRYYQTPDALILVAISSTFNLFERIMTQLEKLTPLAFHLTYHAPNTSSINDDQLNTSISSARDWVMTISRRSSKTLTQPIVQTNSNDTFRSTLSRRFNGFFTKTNPSQPSSVVTTKLPETKSPGLLRRSRLPHVFTNSTATKSRGVSPSTTFQSKIPRPSLNVDKPKSARYRSTTLPSK